MSTHTWKLKNADGTIEEFSDIRRKVGNQVIRAYLLDELLQKGRTIHIQASLRGPKNEFKDFAKHFILQAQHNNSEFKILAEFGVYENLRIIGTNSSTIYDMDAADIINLFTEALQSPEQYRATLLVSEDTKLVTK
ncbi:MAG: hypothetical protein K9W43_02920 [Candidatus Thorarchaeota archaeon]|nr:hypothetical protein [Candidatus Thorarchaeota archaeon]